MSSQATRDVAHFWIKAKPNSKKLRPPRALDWPQRGRVIEITTNAPAADHQANDAILAFLAKEIGITQRDIGIKTGATAPLKQIEVCIDTQSKKQLFQTWIAQFDITSD